MRVLDKIVLSQFPPDNINVLWLEEKNSIYTLYTYGDIGWEAVTLNSQELAAIVRDINIAKEAAKNSEELAEGFASTASEQAHIAQEAKDIILANAGSYISVAHIYNGLDKFVEGFALDARQGKVLNDNIYTLYEESIGNIDPLAESKPEPLVTRRFRFTKDAMCSFTNVEFEQSGNIYDEPFPVKKDDELHVIRFGETFYYRFYPIATKEATNRYNGDYALQEQINSLDTAMGDVSSALDEILLIGGGI